MFLRDNYVKKKSFVKVQNGGIYNIFTGNIETA